MVDACAFAGIRRLAVALPGGCGQTGNVTAPSDRLQRGAQLRQPRPPGDVTGCRHVQPDPSAPLQDAGRGGVCRVRVAARDRSRAEQFAARFGIATAYGDYAEMVAAPDVDIVYVGTITCWGGKGGSTQTSSSGYGPIWTSGWQSMESRPEGRLALPPPSRIHQGRDVGGAGCGGLKALLSCHAISIIRALRFWTPGSTCTFWQMSAWKRFSTVPES